VTVTTATIDAVADAGTPINSLLVERLFTNVLANDTLNNAPVVADQVNTFVSATNAGIIVWYQCTSCCGYACWKLLFGIPNM
jgi:hypothetical protein